MLEKFLRPCVGSAFAILATEQMGYTTQLPLILILILSVVICIICGLGSYFLRRGEKKWTAKGMVMTVTLMTGLGFASGAGLVAYCEMQGIPNMFVILVCGLIGIFGINLIETFPSIFSLLRALRRAYNAFSDVQDDGKDSK